MENKLGKTIRYQGPLEDTTLGRPDSAKEVEQHIAKHVGETSLVIHELASRYVHVDVHIVPPSPGRDFHTLVTSGMSDKPMNTPPRAEQLKYAELMLCLPTSWDSGKAYEIMSEETWRKDWPVMWLRQLARFPHEYGTWFFWSHSMPNGDPPQPLAPGTSLCGWVLLEPKLVREEFKVMTRADGGRTWFIAAVPVYKEEIDLKLSEGTERLQELLTAAGVTELVDPKRINVALKN